MVAEKPGFPLLHGLIRTFRPVQLASAKGPDKSYRWSRLDYELDETLDQVDAYSKFKASEPHPDEKKAWKLFKKHTGLLEAYNTQVDEMISPQVLDACA